MDITPEDIASIERGRRLFATGAGIDYPVSGIEADLVRRHMAVES